jgi:hypothetical protein
VIIFQYLQVKGFQDGNEMTAKRIKITTYGKTKVKVVFKTQLFTGTFVDLRKEYEGQKAVMQF